MGWQYHLIEGVKAVFAGAAIGMALPTVFMIALVWDEGGVSQGETVLLILMPFGVGVVAAGIGLIVVGFPITAWLARRNQESWRAYFTGGLIGGSVPVFLITLVLIGASGLLAGGFVGALFVSAFGAVTGGAVGHFWWVFARKTAALNNTEGLTEMFE